MTLGIDRIQGLPLSCEFGVVSLPLGAMRSPVEVEIQEAALSGRVPLMVRTMQSNLPEV